MNLTDRGDLDHIGPSKCWIAGVWELELHHSKIFFLEELSTGVSRVLKNHVRGGIQ